MLEIQENNLHITHIDPSTFKIIISELTNPGNFKNEIVKLTDFLILNEKIDIVKDYYCTSNKCLNMAMSKVYCDICRCTIEGCISIKRSDECNFCMNHKCKSNNCVAEKYKFSDYCIFHKCRTINYNNGRLDSIDFCQSHKCLMINFNFPTFRDSQYCENHINSLYEITKGNP